MDNPNAKLYLGLGKVLFNSSVCRLSPAKPRPEVEVFLSERITRKKADGTWPEAAIQASRIQNDSEHAVISDNRDVKTPKEKEEELNSVIPFFDYLKNKNLARFSSVLNSDIKFVPHHLAHAQVAKFMSPYDEAIILVLDGAGSKNSKGEHEECSYFHLKDGNLNLVHQDWQEFVPAKNCDGRWYSKGIGTCYEMVAEFIFDSKRAAGKVMGLAAYGKAQEVSCPYEFLESLDWNESYKGKSKSDWENSESLNKYENIAATIQSLFEKILFEKLKKAKKLIPNVENLIIIGGCALNCVANQKVLDQKLFKSMYAPPNPGDEGIGLGCALNEFYKNNEWCKFSFDEQHGYFGAVDSIPSSSEVETVFSNYKVSKQQNISETAADLISKGEVIAWFQGRSESGPRALGNRSILARMDKPNLKSYLNESIKFREAFRPYGASILEKKASEYFHIHESSPNPFMSFAVPIREEFKEKLKEICHIDGTSRIQTVSPGQNQRYFDLIEKVGEKTGLFGVLNTSLNIMGEPILETVVDAEHFLKNSEINHLLIGDYLVEKTK